MSDFLDEIKSLTNTAEQNVNSKIEREREICNALVEDAAKQYSERIKACIRTFVAEGKYEKNGDTYTIKGYTQIPLIWKTIKDYGKICNTEEYWKEYITLREPLGYITSREYDGYTYRPVDSIESLNILTATPSSHRDSRHAGYVHTTDFRTYQCDYYKIHKAYLGEWHEWTATYTCKPNYLKCIERIKDILEGDNIQFSQIWVIDKRNHEQGKLLSREVIPLSERLTLKQSKKEYIELYEASEFVYKYNPQKTLRFI